MEIREPAQGRDGDITDPWRQIGEVINRGQSQNIARFERLDTRFDRFETRFDRLETRFDRLEGDIAVLKTDVVVLKTDLAETKDRLGCFELATERRFNRVDAQLERLITLVQRAETTP